MENREHVDALAAHRELTEKVVKHSTVSKADMARLTKLISDGFSEAQAQAQQAVASSKNNLDELNAKYKAEIMAIPGFNQASFDAGLKTAGRIQGAASEMHLEGK